MKKVTLFIAMSLDGFIADIHGGVDWLHGQDDTDIGGDSYSEFIQTVDTVVMGWNTYHQIVTELSPDEWVYQGLQSYVITHRTCEDQEGIVFSCKDPAELIRELKTGSGKDIWICGGANVIGQLLDQDLIDQFHISVIPTILGSGIRLFHSAKERRLTLLHTKTYNGITDLVYTRR